jgi:glutamyl/glutaminyl-tRNA synthetase
MVIFQKSHVLRAKIDIASSNMLMRDPLIYRVLHRHHHRTGNDWKIYPMYDFYSWRVIILSKYRTLFSA